MKDYNIYPNERKLALWHYVSNTKYLGPIRFRKLWKLLGNNIGRIFEMNDRELIGLKDIVTPQVLNGIKKQKNNYSESEKFAKEQLNRAKDCGGSIVLLDDKEYPYFLRESKMCHPILYCLGNIHNFSNYDNSIAVLGSRRASKDSLSLAKNVARKLAQQGWVIVGGMAKGIDASAHEGALDERGRTIAVLGSGVDKPYPLECKGLYSHIIENNLVVSEFPFGARTSSTQLKKRNKTIVAFSLAAFVVQSSKSGGAMNAVKACKEQHKAVFSVSKRGEDYSGNRDILAKGGYSVDTLNAVRVIKQVLLKEKPQY